MKASDNLVTLISEELAITWEMSSAEKNTLTKQIERGMASISRYSTETLDFDASGKPQELLIEYVRYVRAGVLDKFKINYAHEIINLKEGDLGDKK